MKKISIFIAITSAIALTASMVFAENNGIEKCQVIKNGKGLIKAMKADCATTSHSCAGQNKADDPDSWIMVPKGQCIKINSGDLAEINQVIKDKLEEI